MTPIKSVKSLIQVNLHSRSHSPFRFSLPAGPWHENEAKRNDKSETYLKN